MARMPDGWVVLIENDGIHTWVKETRELVLCKDCKHSDTILNTTQDTMPLKCPSIRHGDVQPYWYCEHGERRGDDG